MFDYYSIIVIYLTSNIMAYEGRQNKQAATIHFRQPNQSALASMHSRHFSDFSKISSDWLEQSSHFTLKDQIRSYQLRKPSYDSTSQPSQYAQLEREHQNLVTQVHQLINTTRKLSKHQRIRIKEWLIKLEAKQHNPVWKKNVIFYLKTLSEMIQQGIISHPFNNLPAEGPLPKLTIYDLPYPLRQRLSHSKQHAHSKPRSAKQTSRDSLQSRNEQKNQQPKNKSREQGMLDKISMLKGFDLNQKGVLNKKISLGNIFDKPVSKKGRFELNPMDFDEEAIQMSLAMKPNISNHKVRKDHLNKSNSHKNSKRASQKINNQDKMVSRVDRRDDKENNPNVMNLSRKLFHSKDKTDNSSVNTLFTQHYNSATLEDNHYCHRRPEGKSTDPQQEQASIFGKMYKMLQENQIALKSQPEYDSLLCEIKEVGKQLQLPQFKDAGLDDSTLSQNTREFMKARQEIKHKFEETDNQTLEFMQFLQRIRSKEKSSSAYFH